MTEHNLDVIRLFSSGNPVCFSLLSAIKEIRKSDVNLYIPRYVNTFEEEREIDLMAVCKGRLSLQKKLNGLEVGMAGYLEELGYGS